MTPVLPNSGGAALNEIQLSVLREVDRGQIPDGTILLPSGLLEWRPVSGGCEIGPYLTEAGHAALALPNTRGGG